MIDNHDGTITDETTGLMWQQETPKAMTYFNADTYCGDLHLGGHIDWRLPTITELKTIVDRTKHLPAINTKYFPWLEYIYPYYISCSPCDNAPDKFYGGLLVIWGVEFEYGNVFGGKAIEKHHFRAVRTVKPTTDRPKKTQLELKL